MLNILLTSVGRRSYLVHYFKEALNGLGKVHVANSTDNTPAFECADASVVTPLIYDTTYIDFLLEYCLLNKITVVISLFDIDLLVLSENKKKFEEKGIYVIVSDKEIIEICNDKWKTYNYLLANGFNVPKTFLSIRDVEKEINKGKLTYPVILKPRWGMGSISVYVAENEEELKVFYKKIQAQIQKTYLKYESSKTPDNMVLIQEKLCGNEYGLDIINDLNGDYQNTIVKRKFAMRSGETDCSMTIKDIELEKCGEKLALLLKHIGNLDVDVFYQNGIPYILEMNARFGGGYPFSHMAGANLPKAIIKWTLQENVDRALLTSEYNVLAHKDIQICRLHHDSEDKQQNEY